MLKLCAVVLSAAWFQAAFAQSPSVPCGTLTPDLQAWASWDRDVRVAEAVGLGLAEVAGEAKTPKDDGWSAKITYKSSCLKQTDATSDTAKLVFIATATRNGNCIHENGSCARASPEWRTTVTAPPVAGTTMYDVNIAMERTGGFLNGCFAVIGNQGQRLVPPGRASHAFAPVKIAPGPFDVVVRCPLVPNACMQGGPADECHGSGKSVTESAKLTVSIRVSR